MFLQPFMMVGQASFYGSMHLYDQYRDMRLEVEDMTYEVIAIQLILISFFIISLCF